MLRVTERLELAGGLVRVGVLRVIDRLDEDGDLLLPEYERFEDDERSYDLEEPVGAEFVVLGRVALDTRVRLVGVEVLLLT